MEDEYATIVVRIEEILRTKGYNIVNENNTFVIRHGVTKISEITLQITDGDFLTGKTRSSYANLVNKDAFNVSWLGTHENYTGQKLGTLLLIYAICDLKSKNPHIDYVKLDDDTDKSTSISNIYNKLGFSFRDHVFLSDKTGEIVISSPDKQLVLNGPFISSVNDILDQIAKTGGKKTKRKRKRKRKYTRK